MGRDVTIIADQSVTLAYFRERLSSFDVKDAPEGIQLRRNDDPTNTIRIAEMPNALFAAWFHRIESNPVTLQTPRFFAIDFHGDVQLLNKILAGVADDAAFWIQTDNQQLYRGDAYVMLASANPNWDWINDPPNFRYAEGSHSTE